MLQVPVPVAAALSSCRSASSTWCSCDIHYEYDRCSQVNGSLMAYCYALRGYRGYARWMLMTNTNSLLLQGMASIYLNEPCCICIYLLHFYIRRIIHEAVDVALRRTERVHRPCTYVYVRRRARVRGARGARHAWNAASAASFDQRPVAGSYAASHAARYGS